MSEQPANSAPKSAAVPGTGATPVPLVLGGGSAPAAGATRVAPPPPPAGAGFRPLRPGGIAGRRYGFLCSYCSSRLEAVESMAGQTGTCPTCGNSIVIPILDYRGRLVDPTSGQIIKQDPHPVHAYAAAGHKAPQIVGVAGSDEHFIRCPRCGRNSRLTANNCLGCGMPFTMEGTVGDAVSGTNAFAVASLVLGIVGLFGSCFFVPGVLAIIFGILGMRTTNRATGQTAGAGLAMAGLILGCVSIPLGFLLIYVFTHGRFP